MSASQDTSFCVPVYGGQAESASDSQDKDHSGSKQDQEVSAELVPVFCPSWRGKSQTAVERRKDETSQSASLVSSLSDEHTVDKRPGIERNSADVRSLCTSWSCSVALTCTTDIRIVWIRRNAKPTETPRSVVVKPTQRQR